MYEKVLRDNYKSSEFGMRENMEDTKMEIEINNHSYENGKAYVAITFRGGFATNKYSVDGNEIFHSNYAFYNVLFNYYKIAGEADELKFDVLRAASVISFIIESTECIYKLQRVLNVLFDYEYSKEIFQKAKNQTKEGFAVRYKEGSFRAKYKAYEFSDLNKCFMLKKLIEDIENIDFDIFVKSAKTLLVSSNMCIYISGDLDQMKINDFKSLNEMALSKDNRIRVAGRLYDPYLRQDAHITNIAREEHNLIIEAFDFLNPDITNFAKLCILELYAEQLSCDEIDVWVDSLDSNIIFSNNRLSSFKHIFLKCEAERFEFVKKKLIEKYVILLERNPEYFTIKASLLMTIGIYIEQYIEFLNNCTYEQFEEICQKSDYIVSEAQISLRKESR